MADVKDTAWMVKWKPDFCFNFDNCNCVIVCPKMR